MPFLSPSQQRLSTEGLNLTLYRLVFSYAADDDAVVLCGAELSDSVKQQYTDNIDWIKHAHLHNLVSIAAPASASASLTIVIVTDTVTLSRCTSQKISGEWREPRERQACAPRDPFTEYSRATNVVVSNQKLPLRAKLIRIV